MIAFDLQCSNGHCFEGWFEHFEAYDEQLKQGMVTCPYCDDSNIKRVLSPINIKRVSDMERVSPSMSEEDKSFYHFIDRVTDYVEKNFEDVGTEFANEALKMHYGVKEKKQIRGITTKDEEKLLREEGVVFFKFPVRKKDPRFNH